MPVWNNILIIFTSTFLGAKNINSMLEWGGGVEGGKVMTFFCRHTISCVPLAAFTRELPHTALHPRQSAWTNSYLGRKYIYDCTTLAGTKDADICHLKNVFDLFL